LTHNWTNATVLYRGSTWLRQLPNLLLLAKRILGAAGSNLLWMDAKLEKTGDMHA
jgi:hypothetical protein